jgi:hypothetical protein
MPDLTTITAVTTLVGAIRSLVGNVKDASLKSQLQGKIVELQEHLLRTQPIMMSLQQENEELKRKLREKNDAEAFVKECDIRGGAYFQRGTHDPGYCGGCMSKGQKVAIAQHRRHGSCPSCGATYSNIF